MTEAKQQMPYNPYYNPPQNNYGTNEAVGNKEWKDVNMNGNQEEDNDLYYNSQWDTEVRLGFIRKVYGILSFQLLMTFFVCAISMTNQKFSQFQVSNPAIFYLCIITTIITSIAIVCCRSVARSVPLNYILLGVFTACESYLVSFICGTTNPKLVLMAAAMTCGVVIALTLYAYFTKTDFTVMGSLMFVIACIMILFSIFMLFTQNKTLHIIYSCVGVLAFSIYLIYDTQLIVGNHENKLDVDDFIVGALMLYMDIINLFLHILNLLKQADS